MGPPWREDGWLQLLRWSCEGCVEPAEAATSIALLLRRAAKATRSDGSGQRRSACSEMGVSRRIAQVCPSDGVRVDRRGDGLSCATSIGAVGAANMGLGVWLWAADCRGSGDNEPTAGVYAWSTADIDILSAFSWFLMCSFNCLELVLWGASVSA